MEGLTEEGKDLRMAVTADQTDLNRGRRVSRSIEQKSQYNRGLISSQSSARVVFGKIMRLPPV